MPTFRNSEVLDSAESKIKLPFPLPGFKNEEELRHLDKTLKHLNVLLIIKKHPVQKEWGIEEDAFENIRFVNQEMLDQKEIQLYELISVSDGLISDYSSVAVDYMLLNRPLAFVLSDMTANDKETEALYLRIHRNICQARKFMILKVWRNLLYMCQEKRTCTGKNEENCFRLCIRCLSKKIILRHWQSF